MNLGMDDDQKKGIKIWRLGCLGGSVGHAMIGPWQNAFIVY